MSTLITRIWSDLKQAIPNPLPLIQSPLSSISQFFDHSLVRAIPILPEILKTGNEALDKIFSTENEEENAAMSSSSVKKPINTTEAPTAIPGIYNQAIVAGNTVYCSGQVAMDAATGKIVDGDVQAHTV